MDGSRFDALSRSLAAGSDRRRLTRLFGGLAFGGILATRLGFGLTETVAKRKHHPQHGQAQGKKKKPCPPCKKRQHGKCKGVLPDGSACAGGTCQGGSCLPIASPPPPPPPSPPPGPGRVPLTLTFTNPTPITIPAGAPDTTQGAAVPYPSIIHVAGFANGLMLDVNVTLHGFSHQDPNDVNVLLLATQLPTTDAIVMGGVGGTADVQNLSLTFDDQAAASPPNSPLVSGTFTPTNYGGGNPFPAPAPVPSGNVALGVFTNGNPNGTWQLWVADDSATGTGAIAGGWSLQITAEVDA